ncbi:hypothetical protein Droror1_Dr00005749 [Drosera rotundifolia]
MDACEAAKSLLLRRRASVLDTHRGTLVQSEKKDGVATRRSQAREVTSRYRSPSPAPMLSVSRRSESPRAPRIQNSSPQLAPRRAQSVERKRPYTPPSSFRPSTPVKDISAEVQVTNRKMVGSRLPESLWPSTMRSLSVSFQSDTISIPVIKKEKPVSHAVSDRALKASSNAAHWQGESPAAPRKATPERRRSPLKGKNSSDQVENSRPGVLQSRTGVLQSRMVDQHRWPSRASGKVASSIFSRSVDLGDRSSKFSNYSVSSTGKSSLRRLSAEGIPRPLQKSTSDAECQSLNLYEIGKMKFDMKPQEEDTLLDISALRRLSSSSSNSSEKSTPPAPKAQSRSLPGSRLPSPSRTPTSRGMASPLRTRPSTPTPSRCTSPSPIRPSSPTRQPNHTSVLSFIADIKRGKKGTNQLEDVHQLRLLYNRYLQWRFANARADDALFIQKVTAERTLHNVWRTTLSLWNSLIMKRITLQQLNLELKLSLVLNQQLTYLEDWAQLEGDHSTSLGGVIKDLEASTLRVPITGGAKTDMESLKTAICCAANTMQLMGSSISTVLDRVEGISCLVTELAKKTAYERAMLGDSVSLLASVAAMQVQEYSLRTQLIQLQQNP